MKLFAVGLDNGSDVATSVTCLGFKCECFRLDRVAGCEAGKEKYEGYADGDG